MPKNQVVFNFDTTGSVRPCIRQIQRNVAGAFAPLFTEIPGLEIGVGANGDYCDARTSYVTTRLDLTTDLHKLTQFVRNIGYTDGGDAAECYELVLNEARQYSWAVHAEKVFVLIGDDVPHSQNDLQNKQRLNWRAEAQVLRDLGVTIYAVQCLNRRYAESFYRELGDLYFTLDQFSEVPDLIQAMCYKQAGDEALTRFEETVARAGRMNRALDKSFRVLAGRGNKSTRYKPVPRGLNPVSPGRFQILFVDETTDIRGFVEENGLVFNAGRGFYEFTKPETIQENKEVVLRDKVTGDMYSGNAARNMIGLPPGIRGRIKPADLGKYDVFVQSTSYNRKLVGGTRFLYEVDMSR